MEKFKRILCPELVKMLFSKENKIFETDFFMTFIFNYCNMQKHGYMRLEIIVFQAIEQRNKQNFRTFYSDICHLFALYVLFFIVEKCTVI